MTVVPDEDAVRAVAPDLDAAAAPTRREALRGVIVTPPAGADRTYDSGDRVHLTGNAVTVPDGPPHT